MPRNLSGARGHVARCANASRIEATKENKFVPRTTFTYPSTVPSWYIGHMHRAMRSFPVLLNRSPPPLVLEVRDARLPLTSINFEFENVVKNVPNAHEKIRVAPKERLPSWRARRLVVYTKRDLIEDAIEKPLIEAFAVHDQDIMFTDTRRKSDVQRIYDWVCSRAKLFGHEVARAASRTGRVQRPSRVSGAARYTPTPETGIRLLIVGMPNVGKSSLLNALRFVGTGKKSAASTHPHPGHTRKVTGTVRLTPAPPSFNEIEAEGKTIDFKALVARQARQAPAVYAYDTPGIMVPHFNSPDGHGPERALKLAVAGCIKQALFDSEVLVDYLLYRMNLRHMHRSSDSRLPPYTKLMVDPHLTDDINEYLKSVAERAPGARQRFGELSLSVAADYVLEQYRRGVLGNRELDLHLDEIPSNMHADEIRKRVDRAFHRIEQVVE